MVGSPLGDIRLACTPPGLAGLWFVGQADDPGEAVAPRLGHRWLDQAAEELQGYWQRLPLPDRRFTVPLDLQGTAFQRAVWLALQDVPEGAIGSYARLAARAGHPGAVRAVGAAVGRNPVSVIVPCHRIVASDGRLTGFGGGLPRKLALLRLEGVLPGPAWAPTRGRPTERGQAGSGALAPAASPGGAGRDSPPVDDGADARLPLRLLARLRVPRSAWWHGELDAQPHGALATQPDGAQARASLSPAQAELPWAGQGPHR